MADKAKVVVDKMTTTNSAPSIASPVPIEKSADWEMDGRETSGKFLCQWAANVEQKWAANPLPSTPDFMGCGYHLQAMKSGRLPQEPHTPSESPRYFAAAG